MFFCRRHLRIEFRRLYFYNTSRYSTQTRLVVWSSCDQFSFAIFFDRYAKTLSIKTTGSSRCDCAFVGRPRVRESIGDNFKRLKMKMSIHHGLPKMLRTAYFLRKKVYRIITLATYELLLLSIRTADQIFQ